MRDFKIQLTHRPGELADVANALSLKGVNIKSLAALNLGNQALMRLIPDDADAARNALRDRNIRFEENEVISVLLENKAGELTGVASKLSEAGLTSTRFTWWVWRKTLSNWRLRRTTLKKRKRCWPI